MTADTWYIIVNPRAGSGKTMSEWTVAQEELGRRGISYVSVLTQRPGHAAELAYSAALDGYRTFIAVGGDGSVHEVLCGISRAIDERIAPASSFFLSVIPIGSGNDWIKTIGIPHETTSAIAAAGAPQKAREDIMKIHFPGSETGSSVASNVAGVGFDSHVCEIVNEQKRRGHRSRFIFIKAIIRTVVKLKSINISVVCDGNEVFRGQCYSISIGNGRFSGGGLLQTPGATIDDGTADMLIIPKLSIPAILCEVPKLFGGTIDRSSRTKTVRFRKAEIRPLDSSSADIFEIDGEVVGKLPVRIEMTGEQFNIPSPFKNNEK